MRRLVARLVSVIAAIVVIAGVGVAPASAQTPAAPNASAAQPPATAPAPATAAAPAAAAAPAPAPAQPAASAPPEGFTYQPEGRRDPFVNLLAAGVTSDVRTGSRRDGAGAYSVNEISVRGILESRGALVAMIQGPDNKTYIVHAGDKLLDGTIKRVTTQGLIVMQEVTDPLSLVKQREVSKLLRSLEGVK